MYKEIETIFKEVDLNLKVIKSKTKEANRSTKEIADGVGMMEETTIWINSNLNEVNN